jgi:hypothetical protein
MDPNGEHGYSALLLFITLSNLECLTWGSRVI